MNTPTPAFELGREDAERLRAAAGWARIIARAGLFGIALVVLLLLDVGLRNPHELARVTKTFGAPNTIAALLSIVAAIGGVALLGSYASNVSAFMRGEAALDRAFCQLRRFFVLWTWFTALAALLGLLNALWLF